MSQTHFLKKVLDFSHSSKKNHLADRANPFFKLTHRNTHVTYMRDTSNQIEIGVFCQQVFPSTTCFKGHGSALLRSQNHQLGIGLAPEKCKLQSWPGETDPGITFRKDMLLVDKHPVHMRKYDLKNDDIIGIGVDVYQECLIIGYNGAIETIAVNTNYIRCLYMHPVVMFTERNEQVKFIFQEYSANVKQFIQHSSQHFLQLNRIEKSDMAETVADYLLTMGMTPTLRILQEESGQTFPRKFSKKPMDSTKYTNIDSIQMMLYSLISVDQIDPDTITLRQRNPQDMAADIEFDQEAFNRLEEVRRNLKSHIMQSDFDALEEEVERELESYGDLEKIKRNIRAHKFAYLIKKGLITEAIQYGRARLVEYKDCKFLLAGQKEVEEVSFSQITAHLAGKGLLLEQEKNNRVVLQSLLQRGLMDVRGLMGRSILERELEEVQDYNEEIKRENLPFAQINFKRL